MERIKATIEVLSPEEIEQIHKSSLRILENVGMKVTNDECLTICEKIGANVDKDLKIVKINSRLMEEIISKNKSNFKKSREDDTEKRLAGSISPQVFIVDYNTGTRRYGLLDDVKDGIILTENLKNIEEANAVVVPSDVPHDLSDVLSFEMIYNYSKKPGGTYILSPESAQYIIEMAKVMGKRINYLFETISPLQFRKETLEIGLVFAKNGQGLSMGPMVIGGASGPVTLAGTITLQNAEMLGSLFLIYALTNEFSNYGFGCHTMDLETGLCSFGSPNQGLMAIAFAQLGDFYGIKAGGNCGLTDAMRPDFQAGFEKGVTAILGFQAGLHNVGDQGIVGADQGISFEQLVIDNEWIDAINYINKGILVNKETIAEDIIEKIGIAGNFLADDHTVKYMKDNYWKSKTFNRDNWTQWEAGKKKDAMEKAHEIVNTILNDKKDPEIVIDKSKSDDLKYIVESAKKHI